MKKMYFSLLATIISGSITAQIYPKETENINALKCSEYTHNALSLQEREKLLTWLHYSYTKFEKSLENLSEKQIYFKESTKKWFIAECIEHITLAELHFPEIVEKELKKAMPKKVKIKISDEKIRAKMTKRTWKARSPEVFKPSNKFKNYQEALLRFSQQRMANIEYLKNTQDNLRMYYWKHPLTGTIDLYQTILLMSAHLERHTEQIESIKKSKNFPNE